MTRDPQDGGQGLGSRKAKEQHGSRQSSPSGEHDASRQGAQEGQHGHEAAVPPPSPATASIRLTSAAASSGACCSMPSDCILATKVRYALDGTPLMPPPGAAPQTKGAAATLERSWLLRASVLVMLMLLNTINFWDRNLLYNLSATETPGCDEVCADAVEVPTCMECSDVLGLTPLSSTADTSAWDQCDVCRLCRISAHSDYYNMKDGACLSSWQYSVLSGFGFTLSFAIVGVFAGYLADRFDRRMVHTAAILLWSLATIGAGMCDSFLPLLACRALLGLGQAFNAPCCYALLTAHFQEGGRPLANGIYSMGTYLGAGLSSLSILLALAVGWRDASYLAGTVGLGLAVAYSLLITSHPPAPRLTADIKATSKASGSSDSGAEKRRVPADALEEVSEVLSSRALLLLCLASSLRMVGTTTLAAYLPVLVQRAFLPHVSHFSLLNAVGYSVCGSLSSSFGGLVAGSLAKQRRGPAALAMLPAVGVAAAVVPLAVTVLSPSFWPAMVTLLLQYLLAECWLGPGMAVLQRQLRPEVHGMAVAVLLLCNNLLCNLGPAVVGMVDDGSAASLRAAFLAVMLASYTGSSIVFALLGAHLQHQERCQLQSAAGSAWEGTLEAGAGSSAPACGGWQCWPVRRGGTGCCGGQQRGHHGEDESEREPLLVAPSEAGGDAEAEDSRGGGGGTRCQRVTL